MRRALDGNDITPEIVGSAIWEKVVERFWKKVEKRGVNDCWEWKGNLANGYGRLWLRKRSLARHFRVRAHRLSYFIANGMPIPKGLSLDHLCQNRRCVNPRHLEATTIEENSSRSARRNNRKFCEECLERIVLLKRECLLKRHSLTN